MGGAQGSLKLDAKTMNFYKVQLGVDSEQTVETICSRFIYLHVKGVEPDKQQKLYDAISAQPTRLRTVRVELRSLTKLKEFQFNPFVPRMIDVLIKANGGDETADIDTFISLMKVFCYQTDS